MEFRQRSHFGLKELDSTLGSRSIPDYIVLPTTVAKAYAPPVPYVKEREIGAYTIWRRSGQRS